MWSIPSLPLPSGPLWPGVVVLVEVPCMRQTEIFNHWLYLIPVNCVQTNELWLIRKLQVILSMAVYSKAGWKGLEDGTWAQSDKGEVTRVSMRWDMVKDSLVTGDVNRPPYSTNRTQKTILSQTKPNIYGPHRTVLNTTRKYTERQQDIHQPQISIIILTLFP